MRRSELGAWVFCWTLLRRQINRFSGVLISIQGERRSDLTLSAAVSKDVDVRHNVTLTSLCHVQFHPCCPFLFSIFLTFKHLQCLRMLLHNRSALDLQKLHFCSIMRILFDNYMHFVLMAMTVNSQIADDKKTST